MIGEPKEGKTEAKKDRHERKERKGEDSLS